jgi:hypothetical protein
MISYCLSVVLIVVACSLDAVAQDRTSGAHSIRWYPSMGDRQRCRVEREVEVEPIARTSYKEGRYSYDLSMFMAELPHGRVIFAASLLNQATPPPDRPALSCVWQIADLHYSRSSELIIGEDRRALRIDVQTAAGNRQVAVIVGGIGGKPQVLLGFDPVELCPSQLAPCWNYSRKLNIIASPKGTPFYEITIDTTSWCTDRGTSKCVPASGPQEVTSTAHFTFSGELYHEGNGTD